MLGTRGFTAISEAKLRRVEHWAVARAQRLDDVLRDE